MPLDLRRRERKSETGKYMALLPVKMLGYHYHIQSEKSGSTTKLLRITFYDGFKLKKIVILVLFLEKDSPLVMRTRKGTKKGW